MYIETLVSSWLPMPSVLMLKTSKKFILCFRNILRALIHLFPSSAFPFLAAHSFEAKLILLLILFFVPSFYCLSAFEYEPIIEAVQRTSLPPKTAEVPCFCSLHSGCSYTASSPTKTNCSEINIFLQNSDRFIARHFPPVCDNGNV